MKRLAQGIRESFFVIPLWFVITVTLQVTGVSMLTAHLIAGVLAILLMRVFMHYRSKLATLDSNQEQSR